MSEYFHIILKLFIIKGSTSGRKLKVETSSKWAALQTRHRSLSCPPMSTKSEPKVAEIYEDHHQVKVEPDSYSPEPKLTFGSLEVYPSQS